MFHWCLGLSFSNVLSREKSSILLSVMDFSHVLKRREKLHFALYGVDFSLRFKMFSRRLGTRAGKCFNFFQNFWSVGKTCFPEALWGNAWISVSNRWKNLSQCFFYTFPKGFGCWEFSVLCSVSQFARGIHQDGLECPFAMLFIKMPRGAQPIFIAS